MKKEIELYELFEKYITGTASAEEKNSLDRMMDNDHAIREEFNKHKSMHDLIFESSLIDLKESLQNIHIKHKSERFNRRVMGSGIAIGVIILGLVAWHLLNDEPPRSIQTKERAPINILEDTLHSKESNELIHSEIKETKPNSIDKRKVIVEKKQLGSTSTIQNKLKPDINTEQEEVLSRNTESLMPIVTDIIESKEPEKEIITENELSTEQVAVKPNCDTITIQASFTVEESCNEKATGSIVVHASGIIGGEPPYTYSINSGRNYYTYPVFDQLYAGHYSLWIQDNNGCVKEVDKVYLEGIDCSYEEVFAPYKDEQWKVPSRGKSAELIIYNQRGVLVYRQQIEEGMELFWDGTSQDGDQLNMGVYAFILQFDDSEKLIGNITIVR